MSDYNFMAQLAAKHGFASFTELQETAFSSPEVHDYNRDILVIGQTSTGKTLIPQLLYHAALEEAVARGERIPTMLFAVPYRALAAQKADEFREYFKDYGLTVVQSTGEFRQDDLAIQHGQVHIAVIVNEKAYKYQARNSEFLSQYDYFVLDEIGLISKPDRGTRVDMLIAWAKNQRMLSGRPRMVALATPFFDWSAYIESYNFHTVRAERRPVKLEEITVEYAADHVERVDGNCSFLKPINMIDQKILARMRKQYDSEPGTKCRFHESYCPFTFPCRSDPSLRCPNSGQSCILPVEVSPPGCKRGLQHLMLKICREHLSRGHQILLFANDRQMVKDYCQFLFHHLQDMLPEVPSAEECRSAILAECNMEVDDVYGILERDGESEMEMEYYRAFSAGIGFHSAELPNELRTYIEKNLLTSRRMKIVCSTETLAFGVNSTVDVVLIVDLNKFSDGRVQMLTLNEHRNYAGRAGRLRAGQSADQTAGYVYTLVKTTQTGLWDQIASDGAVPERLYSPFNANRQQTMPFFLLNLMATSGSESMSVEQLYRTVCTLPTDGRDNETAIRNGIRQALKYLKEKGLAAVDKSCRGSLLDEGSRYCLTDFGKRLRGYMLSRDDYDQLLSAMEKYLSGVFSRPDKATFFHQLLLTKHAESGLNGVFNHSRSRDSIEELRSYIADFTDDPDYIPDWLAECDDERTLSILGALLAWSEGESARVIYRRFGIHYALLDKLSEQIAYLIEVAVETVPSRIESIWNEKKHMFALYKMDWDDGRAAIEEKVQGMHRLFSSVYFGVNIDICSLLQDYLRKLEGNEAAELAWRLSFEQLDPRSARQLRRIAVRYRFFETLPQIEAEDVESRNNLNNRIWQYRKDIEGMGSCISAFFRDTFGELFTGRK